MWLTVVFAPVGATLHAMSHLQPSPLWAAVQADIAVAGSDGAWNAPGDGARRADDHADRADTHPHDAAAHCHVCDEWRFLDHALPTPALPDCAASATLPAVTPPFLLRLAADAPWILPRAPPAHRPSRAA
jgi:hypothetical protein